MGNKPDVPMNIPRDMPNWDKMLLRINLGASSWLIMAYFWSIDRPSEIRSMWLILLAVLIQVTISWFWVKQRTRWKQHQSSAVPAEQRLTEIPAWRTTRRHESVPQPRSQSSDPATLTDGYACRVVRDGQIIEFDAPSDVNLPLSEAYIRLAINDEGELYDPSEDDEFPRFFSASE